MAEQTDDPYAPREDETDAEWRLRRHNDPDDPFILGDWSLIEVQEAVDNGWPEARCSNDPPPELELGTQEAS